MMQLQQSVEDIGDVLKDLAEVFTSWKQSIESRLPLVRTLNQISNIASPEAGFVAPKAKIPTPAQGDKRMRHKLGSVQRGGCRGSMTVERTQWLLYWGWQTLGCAVAIFRVRSPLALRRCIYSYNSCTCAVEEQLPVSSA